LHLDRIGLNSCSERQTVSLRLSLLSPCVLPSFGGVQSSSALAVQWHAVGRMRERWVRKNDLIA
jgi:hypothetical protein